MGFVTIDRRGFRCQVSVERGKIKPVVITASAQPGIENLETSSQRQEP
jgi:hypothetical protein